MATRAARIVRRAITSKLSKHVGVSREEPRPDLPDHRCAYFRYWPKADISIAPANVRFRG